jgi:hypothetical protein
MQHFMDVLVMSGVCGWGKSGLQVHTHLVPVCGWGAGGGVGG